MKTNRYLFFMLFLNCLFLATSCQDDAEHPLESQLDTAVLQLSGENTNTVMVDSRAVSGNYFLKNTHYRIWMDGLVKGSNPELMTNRFCAVGHDVVESGVHYIKFQDINNRPEANRAPLKFDDATDKLNFYGLTDPSQQHTPVNGEDGYLNYIQNYLPKDDNSPNEAPTYTLKRLPQQSGKTVTETDTLVDVRYAAKKSCTRQNTSLILPLPFKHILSKVNFEIVQQVNKEAAQPNTPMYPDLSIEGIKVLNQPQKGTFDIKQGKFIKLPPATAKDPAYRVKNRLTDKSITTAVKRVGSVLLFPMITMPTKAMEVVVTLKGSKPTLQKFTKNEREIISAGPNTYLYLLDLTLPVYSNNPSQDPNQTQVPLRLDSNYEYDIQFMIMNNDVRIVTIVPQVYPWIDGETDTNTPEYGWHEEQDLGQPVTFNGVVWSDRNLGASSANPLCSKEDWLKSVGYYYQFDRNIPYFPNSYENERINLETPLATAFSGNNQRLLYPVVNYEAWGVKYPESWQLKPSGSDYDFISTIGEETANRSNLSWGMALHDNKGKTGLWKNPDTQPCPQGWRIPTYQDFMGILPGSVLAGNITFREFSHQDGSGGYQVKDDEGMHREPDFPTDFIQGGTGMNMNSLGLTGLGADGKAYLGNFPCIYREENNDPQKGFQSQYVLSLYENDWQCMIDRTNKYRRGADYVFNFGTIYGIKNVGTSKAYRIKWEIKLANTLIQDNLDIRYASKYCKNQNSTMYSGKTGKQYDGLYGVLVISRYSATAADNFAPVNGSYQWVAEKQSWWENPIEVMYLPICGAAGGWQSGKLFNLGAEGWYATSEETSNSQKRIIWFKIAGDNSSNQALYDSGRSPKKDVVSIRCVRNY